MPQASKLTFLGPLLGLTNLLTGPRADRLYHTSLFFRQVPLGAEKFSSHVSLVPRLHGSCLMMKSWVFCILILLFLSGVTQAQSQRQVGTTTPEIQDLFAPGKKLYDFLQSLPKSPGDQAGLEIWWKLIGLGAYHDRQEVNDVLPGIHHYFEPRLQNEPLFRQELLALHDWSEAQQLNLEHPQMTPMFDESAGQGRFKGMAPGALWRELLSIGKTPKEALELLAFANHSANLAYDLSAQTPFDVMTAEEAAHDRFLESQFRRAKPGSPDFFRLSQEIMVWRNSFEGRILEHSGDRQVTFIFSWPLVLPKALGEHVAISDGLLRRISERFAHQPRPAKQYHVHIAAFMVCEMISAGMDPLWAKALEHWTAWAYRDARLNLTLHEIAIKQRDRQALSAQEQTDLQAAELLRRWFTGGKAAFGVPLPLTIASPSDAIFPFAPKAEMIPRGRLWPILRDLEGYSKPSGMSEPDFLKAKDRVRDWVTEWDWTVAQHDVGANFAAQVCPKGQVSSGRRMIK